MLSIIFNTINEGVTSFSTWINQASGGNDFLAGTLTLALSSLLIPLRHLPARFYRWSVKRVLVTQVFSTDAVFSRYSNPKEVLSILIAHNNSWWFRFVRSKEKLQADVTGEMMSLSVPGTGTYVMFYGHRLLFITYEMITKHSPGDNAPRTLNVRVSTFSIFNRHLDDIIGKIYEKEITSREETMSLRKYISSSNWFNNRPRKNVLDMSYSYLPVGQRNEIVKVVEDFIEKKSWYEERGFSWKNSILLEGPPGTGKSNVIRFLTDHFKLPVFYISCTHLESNSSILTTAISDISSTEGYDLKVVVIEDFDSLTVALDRNAPNSAKDSSKEFASMMSGFTQSDFLNLIDGNNSLENVLYIFTTNHPEKIDAAVLRPGRINHKFHIGPMKTPEIKEFITRNFGEESIIPEKEWQLTIAQLQLNYIVNHDDYDKFIEELNTYGIKGN